MLDRLTRNFHRCLTPTDPELRAPKDTKTRIVPCMYLVQKYGVPEDIDRDSVNMTTMGEFEFGECIFDGTRSFVEEDCIDLIKRFDHATLFHFLEMGMDTCTVFPQNIFPALFQEDELRYTSKTQQADAMLYTTEWSEDNLYEEDKFQRGMQHSPTQWHQELRLLPQIQAISFGS